MVFVVFEKELVAFFHEPGAEILFSGIPPNINYGSPYDIGFEGSMDMTLSKRIVIKNDNCIEDPNYDYYGM